MNEDRYFDFESSSNYLSYTFVSRGRHGDLIKIVTFEELYEGSKTFNLALGTAIENGETDYVSTTNNGDRNKVLATVATIVNQFLDKHPGYNIYITGSDGRRTLLYHRAIAYGYDELTTTFDIYGQISLGNDFEPFDKVKTYRGFLIKRK